MGSLCKSSCAAAHCTFPWLTAAAPSGAEACCFSCMPNLPIISQHTLCPRLLHIGLLGWAQNGHYKFVRKSKAYRLQYFKLITFLFSHWTYEQNSDYMWSDTMYWGANKINFNLSIGIFGLLIVYFVLLWLFDINTQTQTLVFELPWISYKEQEVSERPKSETIKRRIIEQMERQLLWLFSLLASPSLSKWTLISWRQCCGGLLWRC